MRTLCLLLLVAAAAASPAWGEPAPAALSDALAARAMLGTDVWARVVRIENARPRGAWRRGVYPKTVYGLVFELSGILWFYTDTDGTQSLSLTTGTLGRDRADPGRLFLALDPGFRAWGWLDDAPPSRAPSRGRPPNACFVESVEALKRRISAGGDARSPQLLSYYVDTSAGRLGHTVLLFGTAVGLSAIDAESSDRPVSLPADLGADLRTVAAYLRGGPVSAARAIPILCARQPVAGQWAFLADPPAPAG